MSKSCAPNSVASETTQGGGKRESLKRAWVETTDRDPHRASTRRSLGLGGMFGRGSRRTSPELLHAKEHERTTGLAVDALQTGHSGQVRLGRSRPPLFRNLAKRFLFPGPDGVDSSDLDF